MRYLPFILFSISALVLSCTSDKGKDIDPAVKETNAVCDTSAVVSYSAHIAVIINDNCLSCHGPNQSIKLFDHASVQSVALAPSGSLYGSVSQNGTAIPMPPNRPLSACDIEKIRKWTIAGAPDN